MRLIDFGGVFECVRACACKWVCGCVSFSLCLILRALLSRKFWPRICACECYPSSPLSCWQTQASSCTCVRAFLCISLCACVFVCVCACTHAVVFFGFWSKMESYELTRFLQVWIGVKEFYWTGIWSTQQNILRIPAKFSYFWHLLKTGYFLGAK